MVAETNIAIGTTPTITLRGRLVMHGCLWRSVDQNTKQIRAIDSGLEKFTLNGLGGKFME